MTLKLARNGAGIRGIFLTFRFLAGNDRKRPGLPSSRPYSKTRSAYASLFHPLSPNQVVDFSGETTYNKINLRRNRMSTPMPPDREALHRLKGRGGTAGGKDACGAGRETGAVPFPHSRRHKGRVSCAEFGWHHEVIVRSRPNPWDGSVFSFPILILPVLFPSTSRKELILWQN